MWGWEPCRGVRALLTPLGQVHPSWWSRGKEDSGEGHRGHRGQEPGAEDMEESVAREMEERERKLTRNMARMEEQHGIMLKDLHTEIDKMKMKNRGEALVSVV